MKSLRFSLRLQFAWLIVASLSIFTVKLSNAAESKVAWQVEWDRVQRGAEKEGQVAVAIYDQGPLTVELVDAFQKTFPKIKVNSMRARGSQIAPKIIAERRAEKFLVDLFVGGKGTALNTLHVGKLLDPVKPILSLPEVIDGSKWWQGKLRYVDAEEAYVLAFIGNGGGVEVSINTNLVNPKELTSYWDLLNPKWKEKSSPSIRACAGKTGPCCIFTTAALGTLNLQ